MGVIGMRLGTPRRARETFGCTWEHLRAQATILGAPVTSLGMLVTSLGAPATSLVAPRITVEQSGENIIFCGNAASAPGSHSYYLSFNDC